MFSKLLPLLDPWLKEYDGVPGNSRVFPKVIMVIRDSRYVTTRSLSEKATSVTKSSSLPTRNCK